MSSRADRRRVYLLAILWAALAGTPAHAAGTPTPPVGAARLQGQFLLAGVVTAARNVPSEHVGQKVTRTWTFSAPCPNGACQTATLVRARANGKDKLTLRLSKPGYYVGSGRFNAPLRCGPRTYANGQAVPFTITVRVTAASVSANTLVATQVQATYTNRTRTNLTPCFAVLGHDAARYTGHLVGGPPSGGAGA